MWNGSYMNCGYEIKWSYDPRIYERNFCNYVKKPEIWTRGRAIPVRRSNQLSYEATDVGLLWVQGQLSWLERRMGIARSRVQTPS